MKKIAILAVFALVLGLASGAMAWADGSFEGEGEGYGGPISVSVTVSGGEITEVEILDHSETDGISDPAFEEVPAAIVDANSTDVDAASGATDSSDGIMAAVDAALADADADAEEPAEEPEVDEDEELPETGGGVLPLMPGIGGLIAAGGALLIAKRK